MIRKLLSLILLFLILVFNNTSTHASQTKSSSDDALEAVKAIEQKSFFPYQAYLVSARRKQDEKPFVSAVLHLMFERKTDGSWKPVSSAEAARWQEELDQSLLGCSAEKNSLNKGIAFKPQAEFYIRHTKSNSDKVVIKMGSQTQEVSLKKGCMQFSKTFSVPCFGTFEDLKSAEVSGFGSEPISLPLFPEFKPFILLRYQNGEMLPVPARLDTILYDPDAQRLYFTYRATALLEEPIRKLEYRLLGPDDWIKGNEKESRTTALARHHAMREYLDHCPRPRAGWAGEPCADPKGEIDFGMLSRALGLTHIDKKPDSPRPGESVN